MHFFTCGQAEIACTKSRDKSASRGVSNSKRGEGSQREGREGEFVNTLLTFKFTIDYSSIVNDYNVALDTTLFSVC